jgi:hypothetical protein
MIPMISHFLVTYTMKESLALSRLERRASDVLDS